MRSPSPRTAWISTCPTTATAASLPQAQQVGERTRDPAPLAGQLRARAPPFRQPGKSSSGVTDITNSCKAALLFQNNKHKTHLPFVVAYKHAKTIELPQQRSSSVATQQTTVSSVPSHPSTAGVSTSQQLC